MLAGQGSFPLGSHKCPLKLSVESIYLKHQFFVPPLPTDKWGLFFWPCLWTVHLLIRSRAEQLTRVSSRKGRSWVRDLKHCHSPCLAAILPCYDPLGAGHATTLPWPLPSSWGTTHSRLDFSRFTELVFLFTFENLSQGFFDNVYNFSNNFNSSWFPARKLSFIFCKAVLS